MSDTPKFEVIDRRKYKAEEEKESSKTSEPPVAEPVEPHAGPRLVVTESKSEAAEAKSTPPGEEAELPPPPTAQERSGGKTWDGRKIRPSERSRRWALNTWCSSSTFPQ